ncbi:protein mono-ADP-ribosyltransferase PARP12-like isoform X2 [Mercenaria mercenaria]|uniref:protein mono-ADP-ribosyltransferase PARP12-like isoform X2 n=1 Tax=Mercenaria mercenaria TaxID=6596 RepID=UPI00234E5337|nr:protein mono-ADP-ribosyltransferase PARP12-like isoform X2 [Mercenaria mercenaria]
MPAVQCPVPGCDYITDDLDSAIVVALINAHSASHTGGEAVKVKSASRTSGTSERSRSQDMSGRRTNRKTCPKICNKYNGNGCEKADSCPYIHMCKSYVESRCASGRECSKSHDIFNPAVKAKLEKYGINTKRRPREVLAEFQAILKDDECGNSKAEKSNQKTSNHTAPKICYDYNGNGCGRTGSCSFIHMCRSYVERRCESGKECSKSHDICEPAVKSVLEKHGIDTKRRPREILVDLQAALKGYKNKSNLDETEKSTAGKSEDKSQKQKSLKLCYRYNGNGCEKSGSCPYVHMCKSYVESRCETGKECSKSHDILDPGVKAILVKHGINTKRRPREILADLQEAVKDEGDKIRHEGSTNVKAENEKSSKQNVPKICYQYNGNSCKRAGSCTYIHMCRSYVESRCEAGKDCNKSHDVLNPTVKAILGKHGINTNRRPREIIADLQAAIKGDDSNRSRTVGGEAKAVRTDRKPGKFSRKIICLFNLRGRCRWNFCPNVHSELPYQWRWKSLSEKDWNIPSEHENVQMECAFSDPSNQQYTLTTEDGVTINTDFNTMTGNSIDGNTNTNYIIRRISTPSSVEFTRQPWTTVWLWYWKNEDGSWAKYSDMSGPSSIQKISNNDIEQAYINNSDGQIACDGNGNFIDFSKMVQIHVDDKTEVEVCRRPTFVSEREAKEKPNKIVQKEHHDLKLDLKPEQKVELVSSTVDMFAPPPNWKMSPGEDITDHCQLTMLQDTDTEYREIKSFFYESLPKPVRIKSIERIENGDLWENFVSKRTKMLKKKSKEEIGERRLFHGTRNQYIDPIWHQGFDFRLSGQTSGTAYGKGSYFATNAQYSNSYAEQGADRAMFVVKVLPGSYVRGSSEYKRPPHKDKGNPCSELYDSCVDNESNPQIFIIFDNNQIYPEYLIKYDYSNMSM